MARFIVVVVVLVAIALLANKYPRGGGDAPPANAKQAAAEKDADATVDAKEEATAEAVPSADVETDIVQEAGVDPNGEALKDVKVVGEDDTEIIHSVTLTHSYLSRVD